MATIHFILQGKGGVGKSIVAALLHQGLEALGHEVKGYDTDSVNGTFAAYGAFNASRVEVVLPGGGISRQGTDELLNTLADTPDGVHAVVDNGAASSTALAAFLAEYDILTALGDKGHCVYLHTVLVGGQGYDEAARYAARLLSDFSGTPIIGWLNPCFGDVRVNAALSFFAFLAVPAATGIQGHCLARLYARRQTFREGIRTAPICEKAHLWRYWNEFFSAFSKIPW